MRDAPRKPIGTRHASQMPECRRGLRAHGTCTIIPRVEQISIEDFAKIDARVGRVVRAEDFPEARKPAYKLWIDFGPPLGTRTSSAQLTGRYRRDELPGRLVLAVVNFAPRRIGPFLSEVLTLGVPDPEGNVVLLVPDADVPLGGRVF